MSTVGTPLKSNGYESLLAAVLLSAWRDATGRNPKQRDAALEWLNSPGAENVCDWLGLDVERLRQVCNGER